MISYRLRIGFGFGFGSDLDQVCISERLGIDHESNILQVSDSDLVSPKNIWFWTTIAYLLDLTKLCIKIGSYKLMHTGWIIQTYAYRLDLKN